MTDSERAPRRETPIDQARDDALIVRTLAGDESAFRTLHDCYQHGVRGAIYRSFGHVTLIDPDEVTQEAFVRSFTRLPTFELGSNFPAWVASIARNYARDLLRRARLRNCDSFTDHTYHVASEQSDPIIVAQYDELRAQVGAAISDLSPRMRAAIELVYIEGYSHEEAGQIIGCSTRGVNSRLFRGRNALRATLSTVAQDW